MAENVEYILSLKDLFTSKLKTADEATQKFDDHVNKLKNSARNTEGVFGGLGGMISGAFAVGGIVAFGQKVLDAGGKVEQLGVAFETMLGSRVRADKLLDEIRTFALRTPFEFEDVAQGAKSLLAYGIASDDIIPTLKILGDITAGIGTDKMPQLMLAFGQVRTATKLTGNELRQFSEAGVPLISALAKQFKVAESTIVEMVHSGKIGFEDVRTALEGMTVEGGKFFNLMDKQADTTSGRISNLSDAFTNFATTIFQKTKPAIDVFVEALGGVLNTMNDLLSGRAFTSGGRLETLLGSSFGGGKSIADIKKLEGLGFKGIGAESETVSNFNTALAFVDNYENRWAQVKDNVEETKKFIGSLKSQMRGGLSADLKRGAINVETFNVLSNLFRDLIGKGESALSKGTGKTLAGAAEQAGKTPLSDVESRRATNINVTIGNLIETQEIHAANLPESASKIADEVRRVLLTMLNDVNLIGQ